MKKSLFLSASVWVVMALSRLTGAVSMAPPPAASVHIPGPPAAAPVRLPRNAPVLYTGFGNPTISEQYLLELLNRARANATAEAQRLSQTTDSAIVGPSGAVTYWALGAHNGVGNVSVSQVWSTLIAQYQTAPFAQTLPPLAFNADLLASSLYHSTDMEVNNFQGHNTSASPPTVAGVTEPPNGNFSVRITDFGYNLGPGSFAGENVFAYALSLDHNHAGFEIDWGSGPDGIQNPPGHRYNDHSWDDVGLESTGFREIGIGIVSGPDALGDGIQTGPLVVTYDLGVQSGSGNTAMITGVVYQDDAGTGFYDTNGGNGEGVANVEVSVTGADYFAVTGTSGGYAVPVPGNGSYTVTFSGGGVAIYTTTVTVTGDNSLKLDYVLNAVPQLPVVFKQPSAAKAQPGAKKATFTVEASGVALTYQWLFKNKAVKNGKKYTGVTTPTLTIKKIAKTDAGKYQCRITSAAGAVLSNQVKLTVL